MPATAVKILTEAVDALEEAAGNEVGGRGAYDGVIRAMESAALSTADFDPEGLNWKVRRLLRAIVNEWEPREIGPICASVLMELRAIAADVHG